MGDIISQVIVFGGFFSFLLAISPVGRAVADRIRHGGHGGPAELNERIEQVLTELDGVRQEVAEIQERVDFVERVLARRADPKELNEGDSDGGAWN